MMNETLFLSLYHRLCSCFPTGRLEQTTQEIQITYIAAPGGLSPVVDVVTEAPGCEIYRFFYPVTLEAYHRIQPLAGISCFNMQNLYSCRKRAFTVNVGLLGNSGYIEVRSIISEKLNIPDKEQERKLCCDNLITIAKRLDVPVMPYLASIPLKGESV